MMLAQDTLNHFNKISDTWEQKNWVNDEYFNLRLARFIKSSEEHAGLSKKRHKSALYFGIGTGKLFHQFRDYNLAGIDEAANMLGQCPEGTIRILSKVEDLPFLDNNQFHVTFSRNLLKHCPEPHKAVEQMFQKTRKGGVCLCAESVVQANEDKVIPNTLLRFTDPNHPSVLSISDIITLFERAGFYAVDYQLFPYRSTWLSKWLAAEQANIWDRENALALYRSAPTPFLERQHVVIHDNEITSSVPWMLIRAYKS